MAVITGDRTDDPETHPLLPGSPSVPTITDAKKLLILIVCAVSILSVDFGAFLSVAPQTAIFEQIICRNHLEFRNAGNATLGEDPCKSEAVQGELALIIGYKDGFDVLPTILLSLAYGVLSDHWGRKPVVLLAVLGSLLAEFWTRLVCAWSNVLPLRLVWLSSVWRIFGGGDQTMASVLLNIVADVFSEEERSTALFRLTSCVLVAEVLATPFSAYLMTINLWIPYILGYVIMLVGYMNVFFLPETLEYAKRKRVNRRTADNSTEATTQLGKQSTLQALRHQLRDFTQSIKFMWADSSILWMIFLAFASMISRQSTVILLQYASKKFGWSIAQASLLISIRGVFGIFSFLVLMPALTFLATRYLHLHGKLRDYWLSQGTGLCAIVGFTLIGLAPNPGLLITGVVMVSFSGGFNVSTRSLATSLVLPDHVGTLYSALAISQSIGMLIAGPLFAYLFRLGMHLGNGWMGLPFLQAGLCFAFAAAALLRIRAGRSMQDDEGEQEPLIS
ncbi:uncharacterized protein N7484_002607 [Penicillium longicatenatum]|uniref:uncharacterized protein n=1 Tax=Penicillium longicatenatum TaxID=1561947 RepID=UPI002547D6F1|nr:uncharacterized protein N7484_002607 [Penicillium longicatenatum]KAJ5648884.1 hypothetical protein N7484_002607 [Penicillium longicatenatum]